jgi:hypothetical protein
MQPSLKIIWKIMRFELAILMGSSNVRMADGELIVDLYEGFQREALQRPSRIMDTSPALPLVGVSRCIGRGLNAYRVPVTSPIELVTQHDK